MKKNKIPPRLNSGIVDQFSREEMIVIVGGRGSTLSTILDQLLGIEINGYCPVTNSGNCVEGCAC